MTFKNFYIQIGFRLIILAGLLFLLSLCVVNDLYLRSVYLAVFATGSAVELFFFITRFTKHIQLFLINIRQRDFTFHFKEPSTLGKLYDELNSITTVFQKISAEKEIQHQFLRTMLEHINVGIISFDNKGEIQLANNSFLSLVGKLQVSSMSQFQNAQPALLQAIIELRPEETRVIKFHKHNQVHNLALFAASFKLGSEQFKLVTVQDITHELNLNELEAWQKLIRVLTHEIMNSIAPIVSLSDTLHEIIKRQKLTEENNTPTIFGTLNSGLEAIKVRSQGLQIFTDAYRELMRIPNPEFAVVDMRSFFSSIEMLLLPEFQKRKIKCEVDVSSTTGYIDRKLMEQVILNLLWNAIDAIAETENPEIKITVDTYRQRVKITIADNGMGIEPANIEKIFIPFYTTKKNGSGIGLAVARQIVQLHKGELQVESLPNAGTMFTILL